MQVEHVATAAGQLHTHECSIRHPHQQVSHTPAAALLAKDAAAQATQRYRQAARIYLGRCRHINILINILIYITQYILFRFKTLYIYIILIYVYISSQ